MTYFDIIKKRISSMNVEELIEFCGGDTCENVLCKFVIDGDCCGNGYNEVMIAEAVLKDSYKQSSLISSLRG